LEELSGQVIGVGFEPGRLEVRLKTDGQILTCAATPEQVEGALTLRGREVRALIVRSATNRILRVEDSESPPLEMTEPLREQHLYSKWDELLGRLA
jgi:hypothetical protein